MGIDVNLYQWHEHNTNGTFTSSGFKQHDAAGGAGQDLPAELFVPKSKGTMDECFLAHAVRLPLFSS